jgi:hypothetical protein
MRIWYQVQGEHQRVKSKSNSEMKRREESVALESMELEIQKVDEMSVHTSSGTFSMQM